jgi:hypothetical protein
MFFDDASQYMKKQGWVRLIVMKRKHDADAYSDRGYDLIGCEAFVFGLLSKSDMPSGSSWVVEEIDSQDDWLRSFLSDKPNGFYEIVGQFFYHGWTSGYYEPEYESAWELRQVSWQQMSYRKAIMMGDFEFLENQLNGFEYRRWNSIHPFMPIHDIVVEFSKQDHKLQEGVADYLICGENLEQWLDTLAENTVGLAMVKSMIKYRKEMLGDDFNKEVEDGKE